MADCSLLDVQKGVRDSWDAAASVKAVVPTARVYFKRAGEGTVLPYCVYEFKDVSAYFGGTEYFSGSVYIRKTQVTFAVYATRATDLRAFSTLLNDAFGWSAAAAGGVWTIPNAAVVAAMPEVEGSDLTEERVAGEDVLKYESTFTLTLQCDRG